MDDVIFVVHRRELDRLEDLFLSLQEQGIRTRFAMDLFPHTRARVELEDLDGMPILSFATTPTSQLQLMLKRALDVALASFLLFLGLPIAGMIALMIKLTQGGKILFRQTRCGLNGRSFTLYKFRTMVADAEERRRELMHLNEMNGPVFNGCQSANAAPCGSIANTIRPMSMTSNGPATTLPPRLFTFSADESAFVTATGWRERSGVGRETARTAL